jgi:predicted DNA-binding protein
MAKKLTTLYLDLELIERLNKLSAETRVPRAVYIRDKKNPLSLIGGSPCLV